MVNAEPLLCRVLGAVIHGWGVLGSHSPRESGHSFFNNKTKKQGDLNSLLEDYKTFLLGHCVTVPVPKIDTLLTFCTLLQRGKIH